MSGVVDLHTHILPGIDDGPPDEDTSVEFARALAADGVTTVAATPHLRADHPGVVPGELEERCGELQERLDAEEIPLRLVAGAEVDLNAAMMAGADDLRAASYGGRSDYMLVETPYNSLSRNFEDMMFRAVSSRGIGIVLAHPERNLMLQRDIDRVARLVDRGV